MTREQQAAERTLQQLGYTYHGGEQWKPPIGQAPDFDLIDSLRERIAQLEAQAQGGVNKGEATAAQLESAWRDGWAKCRDAEYVGEEAEDWAWGQSNTNYVAIDATQAQTVPKGFAIVRAAAALGEQA